MDYSKFKYSFDEIQQSRNRKKNTIHDYVLSNDFNFPFLSEINMNDVVYIIPLNKYMYLQEFYMHVCDYYFHDEFEYRFYYKTINI